MKETNTARTPKREQIWTLLWPDGDAEREAEASRLAGVLGVTPVTAKLLMNRGYGTPGEAELFLGNDDRVWHDPMGLADMEKAADRILTAVRTGETIAVYGDYDVDGVTSVTTLYLYLTGLGARVVNYIPSRTKEGYGVSRMGVDALAAQRVDLIITVDTGITANEEIRYAAGLGIDTVVTDHHECHGDLPDCCAVVNPHRPDDGYPFKELAGVGVVFKTVCACEAVRLGVTPAEAFAAVSGQFIDLVAIGTIADVMPLYDENRFIVSRGLAMLDKTERCGIAALLDAVSGGGNTRPASAHAPKKPRRKVNSGLVGYGIAPRINAAGRISHAMKAVDLLLAETPEQAEALTAELCEINVRRQGEENSIAEQAYRMIDESLAREISGESDLGVPWNRQVLVLEDDHWMQGIVGIVASRVTEKYGLPSILISFDGSTGSIDSDDDVGKGSGRSVRGLNLVEALASCQDLLVRFGGHELAAGLSIRRGDIPAFRKKLNEYAAAHLTDEMTALRFEAECRVRMSELTMKQAAELDLLEPYGVSNQTPVFMMSNAVVQKVTPLGAGKHTRLTVMSEGSVMQAVWFGMPTSQVTAAAGDRIDLLFNLNINDFQGVRSLQMIVQDVRPSEAVSSRREEEARLDRILHGESFSASDGLLPDRDDAARVYTLLRGKVRAGRHVGSESSLMEELNADGNEPMSWIKLSLILRILPEMGVCTIDSPSKGVVQYDITKDAPRTTIEASPLYCRLRGQCRE
ncbi:MAG: single-stranded-DNA-specific exonuclease RecJ [Clostridia bacterium]|nr:single-stranded-DNA-specific exonuclease RecJ [Clostridia bacterium]